MLLRASSLGSDGIVHFSGGGAMKFLRRASVGLVAALGVVSTAHAMDMAFATGSGKLQIGAKPQSFSRLSYMHFDNGRTMFSVPTAKGAVSFAGGHDLFASGVYTLVIDSVDIAGTASASSTTTSTHLSVTGTCQMAVSPDFKLFKKLDCMVRDRTGAAAEVVWTGDGSPASRS